MADPEDDLPRERDVDRRLGWAVMIALTVSAIAVIGLYLWVR